MRLSLAVAAVLLIAACGSSGGAAIAASGASGDDGALSVHYINTEYGTATLFVGPTGETLLVDSAGRASEDHVLEYLEDAGIDRVDHLVATHGHSDHISAHDDVIERYETERDGVGTVYDSGIERSTPMYEEYLDAVDDHDVEHVRVRRGDSIPLEGVEVTVLSPPERPLDGGDTNENSLVLRVEYGATSFLVLGDAEGDAEAFLLESDPGALNVTVLQAGKEGSAESTGGALLDAAAPAAAVVSGGEMGDPDRPSEAVLERFAERSIPTYWTASHGTTVATSDGERVTVAVQRNATTEPTSLRDVDPVPPESETPVEPAATVYESESTESPSTTPTATPTPTPTPTPTTTPTPTITPTPTATSTPTVTPTPTTPPSPTPTTTPAPSSTGEPTPDSDTLALLDLPDWVWLLVALVAGAGIVPFLARQ